MVNIAVFVVLIGCAVFIAIGILGNGKAVEAIVFKIVGLNT
jgi:hypothetical protein